MSGPQNLRTQKFRATKIEGQKISQPEIQGQNTGGTKNLGANFQARKHFWAKKRYSNKCQCKDIFGAKNNLGANFRANKISGRKMCRPANCQSQLNFLGTKHLGGNLWAHTLVRHAISGQIIFRAEIQLGPTKLGCQQFLGHKKVRAKQLPPRKCASPKTIEVSCIN